MVKKSTEQTSLTIESYRKESQIPEFWRRFKRNKLAIFGLIIMAIMVFFAITANLWISYEKAIEMDTSQILKPPSSGLLFGADGYGRDMLARCLHGTRISLAIGFLATFGATIAGASLGLMCGYYGGKLDAIVMRILDIFAALPPVLWALVIVAVLGNSVVNLIIALIIARIPSFVRIVRSSVLSEADLEYVEAAQAGGAIDARIMFRHILPNVSGPLIVQMTMSVSNMILTASAMSFLGLRVSSPQPEWGALISEAKEFMRVAPHLMIIPGLLIILASLAMNLMGDGLRDALDPKLRN